MKFHVSLYAYPTHPTGSESDYGPYAKTLLNVIFPQGIP